MSEQAGLDELWMRDMQRRIIDGSVDEVNFWNLLESARAVCLAGEPTIDKGIQVKYEACDPAARKLGALGIRNAIELLAGGRHQDNLLIEPHTESTASPHDFYLGYDSPLRLPEAFGDVPRPEVISAIEAFGKDLLTEAWKTLGTDAKPMIERLKEADSAEDQVIVLSWLQERLKTLKASEPDRPQVGSSKYFYHPVRLSPKLNGQFPHQAFVPTCLGMSVIASSFLEQTGMAHMHAGAMRTYHSELTADYRLALMLSVVHDHSEFPDPLAQAISDKIDAIRENTVDAGYHAISLARLKNGQWCYIDPNFDQFDLISRPRHIDLLDTAYAEIAQFGSQGLPVEKTVILAQPSIPQAILHMNAAAEFVFDVTSVESVLLDGNVESLAQRIADVVCETLTSGLDGVADNESMKFLFEKITSSSDEYPQHKATFSHTLRNNIQKYVLWNMSPENFLDRCENDEQFLRRRLEDIGNAVYVAMADLCGHEADDYARDREAYNRSIGGASPLFHQVIECGAPAYRIGAAVLSDFDVHGSSEQQLSPSFWFTHWASQIPVTETRGRYMENTAQQRRLYNQMILTRNCLNYSPANGIISKYLRQSQDSGREE